MKYTTPLLAAGFVMSTVTSAVPVPLGIYHEVSAIASRDFDTNAEANVRPRSTDGVEHLAADPQHHSKSESSGNDAMLQRRDKQAFSHLYDASGMLKGDGMARLNAQKFEVPLSTINAEAEAERLKMSHVSGHHAQETNDVTDKDKEKKKLSGKAQVGLGLTALIGSYVAYQMGKQAALNQGQQQEGGGPAMFGGPQQGTFQQGGGAGMPHGGGGGGMVSGGMASPGIMAPQGMTAPGGAAASGGAMASGGMSSGGYMASGGGGGGSMASTGSAGASESGSAAAAKRSVDDDLLGRENLLINLDA